MGFWKRAKRFVGKKLPHRHRAGLRRLYADLTHPKRAIDRAVTDYLCRLAFLNLYRGIIHGPADRLHLGKNVRCVNNVLFNTRSGHIYIGDDTVLSFHSMFLTGRHEFERGKLKQPRSRQVPTEGYDIRVGSGCWIGSGAIIIGGVTIGDNCIVAAGAVVTRSFPDGCIIGGVPAKIIGRVDMLDEETG